MQISSPQLPAQHTQLATMTWVGADGAAHQLAPIKAGVLSGPFNAYADLGTSLADAIAGMRAITSEFTPAVAILRGTDQHFYGTSTTQINPFVYGAHTVHVLAQDASLAAVVQGRYLADLTATRDAVVVRSAR